jgi:hypothetical protein
MESGAAGEIRTPDLVLRRHALYPSELQPRTSFISCVTALGQGVGSRLQGLGCGSPATCDLSPATMFPHYSIPSAMMERPLTFTSIEMGGRRLLPCTISPRAQVLPPSGPTFKGS